MLQCGPELSWEMINVRLSSCKAAHDQQMSTNDHKVPYIYYNNAEVQTFREISCQTLVTKGADSFLRFPELSPNEAERSRRFQLRIKGAEGETTTGSGAVKATPGRCGKMTSSWSVLGSCGGRQHRLCSASRVDSTAKYKASARPNWINFDVAH